LRKLSVEFGEIRLVNQSNSEDKVSHLQLSQLLCRKDNKPENRSGPAKGDLFDPHCDLWWAVKPFMRNKRQRGFLRSTTPRSLIRNNSALGPAERRRQR